MIDIKQIQSNGTSFFKQVNNLTTNKAHQIFLENKESTDMNKKLIVVRSYLFLLMPQTQLTKKVVIKFSQHPLIYSTSICKNISNIRKGTFEKIITTQLDTNDNHQTQIISPAYCWRHFRSATKTIRPQEISFETEGT